MNTKYHQVRLLEKNLNFFNIVAAIGGFGNHIRWLVLLDPLYQFVMIPECNHKQKYIDLMGPDWPSYEQYMKSDWSGISSDIKIEVTNLMEDDCIVFDTLEKKINFIQTNIYHESRTWNNWLWYEWQYRIACNKIISLIHNTELEDYDKNIKTLTLTIDPQLAYHCYVKFNNNLNNRPPSDFMRTVRKNNIAAINEAKTNANIKIIDANIVYQPILDRVFYKNLVDYLGISDLYFEANEIHQLWYSAQKRSEKEFVRDITALYK
jgi:hypothetical protein